MNQYPFVWRGTDPQGKTRSERVSAANAQQARDELTKAGWTNLELVQDEVCAATSKYVETDDDCESPVFTVDEEVQFFEGKGPGMVRQWLTSLWRSKKWIIIWGALIGLGIYKRWIWLIVISSIPLAFILSLFPVIHIFFSAGSRNYSRLNRAKIWGRWSEVLECVERLRKSSRIFSLGISEVELVRCRAQAFAGLGRLDEGLTEFRKFEDAPDVEHWMYLSHVGTIYDVAKAWDKAQECRLKAAAEKPDNSSVWIDVGYGFVRGLNQPAEAREALAKAETLEITGLGKAYLPFLRGMICRRERKFGEAKQHLNEALTSLQPLAHNDIVQGIILLTKSYLCAVHSEMGDRAAAKKLFGQVEKFMEANREEELLRVCRGA